MGLRLSHHRGPAGGAGGDRCPVVHRRVPRRGRRHHLGLRHDLEVLQGPELHDRGRRLGPRAGGHLHRRHPRHDRPGPRAGHALGPGLGAHLGHERPAAGHRPLLSRDHRGAVWHRDPSGAGHRCSADRRGPDPGHGLRGRRHHRGGGPAHFLAPRRRARLGLRHVADRSGEPVRAEPVGRRSGLHADDVARDRRGADSDDRPQVAGGH
mmetsp:Transcript_41287/g.83298  ORF Transcript_41287/g.83298 Transcript_41287/m.83298 type:complete len:209 (+) Transcript_41287:300-926(+)